MDRVKTLTNPIAWFFKALTSLISHFNQIKNGKRTQSMNLSPEYILCQTWAKLSEDGMGGSQHLYHYDCYSLDATFALYVYISSSVVVGSTGRFCNTWLNNFRYRRLCAFSNRKNGSKALWNILRISPLAFQSTMMLLNAEFLFFFLFSNAAYFWKYLHCGWLSFLIQFEFILGPITCPCENTYNPNSKTQKL